MPHEDKESIVTARLGHTITVCVYSATHIGPFQSSVSMYRHSGSECVHYSTCRAICGDCLYESHTHPIVLCWLFFYIRV